MAFIVSKYSIGWPFSGSTSNHPEETRKKFKILSSLKANFTDNSIAIALSSRDLVIVMIIPVFKTFAISQHYFYCTTTYKPTAITTDRNDSGSSVQGALTEPGCGI